MSALEFYEVSRAYGKGADVLHGLTFSVDRGQVVGLLGRNGAGKTTLLRVAMGMLAPRHGRVRVFDLDPRAQAVEVKRRIGYVAEDQALPAFLSVGEVVDLHRALYPTWDPPWPNWLVTFCSRRRLRLLSWGRGADGGCGCCGQPPAPAGLLACSGCAGSLGCARRELLYTAI